MDRIGLLMGSIPEWTCIGLYCKNLIQVFALRCNFKYQWEILEANIHNQNLYLNILKYICFAKESNVVVTFVYLSPYFCYFVPGDMKLKFHKRPSKLFHHYTYTVLACVPLYPKVEVQGFS